MVRGFTQTISIVTLSVAASIAAAGPLLHERPEAVAAERALIGVTHDASPEAAYKAFSNFARTHFGAESDPLIYERFGNELKFIETGEWKHVSANSASLAWETNLPAVSYVEYGPTTAYGQKSEPTDRAYFLHMHQLTGLDAGKTYHYRLVAIDERGNKLVSPDQTMQPDFPAGAEKLAASPDGAPIKLEKENTTYVLIGDINAKGGAIITLRDGITLDLNGHTITYATDPAEAKDAHGIIGRGAHGKVKINYHASDLKVVNGTIRQGNGKLLASNTDSLTFNALSITGQDIELAGLRIITHAPQSWAVNMSHSQGRIDIHHNVFRDEGTQVPNRHGKAVRTVGFNLPRTSPNDFVIRNNLIQRTRQNGIGNAHAMFHNEIYVDSWSTNSFAIQPESKVGVDAGEHYGNRIFATGFNPYGFGWAHENLVVRDNLVSMFGLDVKHRWNERWGDVNLLAAMRVTNYGQGGQVRNNLRYSGNLILMRGKQGAELQGTRFFSDDTIENLVFENNTVKVEVLDDQTDKAAPIVVQGHFRKLDSKPVYYRNNRFISNLTLVQFGDAYGKGNNHHFENCTFVRIGEDPRFRTFGFGGAFFNLDHVILDGRFEGGARADDVRWIETGSQSEYEVQWTLQLQTAAGAKVTVTDATGAVVHDTTADADGRLSLPLTECVIRPTEWQPTDSPESGRAAVQKSEHLRQAHTPHTVTVSIDGRAVSKVVNMTGPQDLEVR
jgi:hypothetical protein